ncbi:MAG: DUF4389 domain-containing protein [Chloroflexi bacterium]|nr:DUF4389 domain-containing protein [Chloroflexota bacterium]
MNEVPPGYPTNLTVDYPESLDRLTTFFRIFTVIPISIVLGLLLAGGGERSSAYGVPWYVVIPTALMLIFRQKYPRWWFDWNYGLLSFATRVTSYLALLRDEYPSTDEEQAVHVWLVYPDARRELNRWLPLVKWLLAIPHYIVLFFLWIAAVVAVIIAWFAILFTTRYPRGLFDFVVGVMRWTVRVDSYAFVLTTDRYPPFSLTE